MARKKKASGGGPGSGDWLNTYADMVTLLLTFFILLFSMSSLDSAKFNLMVKAFATDGESSAQIVIRGETTTPDEQAQSKIMQEDVQSLEDLMDMLMESLAEQMETDSISVELVDGAVFIQFMDDMLFEPNSSVLRPRDREILGFVGEAIKTVQGEAKSINIVGHTAEVVDDPNYPVSDRRLSADRANVVLEFFEDQIGIDGKKLYATGFGKWQPIGDNTTPEGMSKNRRVEILISSENNSLSEQLDNVYEKLVE